jgi:uncharacterized protein YneF (UPF0154 family)
MSDNGSGGMTAIVAIVAIIIIVGIGFLVFRNFAGKNVGGNPSVNVELPTGQGQQ